MIGALNRLGKKAKSRHSTPVRRPRPRPRLQLEALEDRLVPATFNVNCLADLSIAAGVNTATGTILGQGQKVTLRSAIAAADAMPGGNVIRLTVPGTYKISLPGANTGTDASGAFAILPGGGNLTIVNTSGGNVTVDGNHLDRVFDINPGFNPANPTQAFGVTLQGFTITGGVASPGDGADGSGGGVRDQGNASLTLNNVTVTNNVATADGGGISMENTVSTPWKLTVNNSSITNNHAGDAGGGIDTDGSGKILLNAGTVITGNTCVNQGAGVWLDAISGTVTGVTITNPGRFVYITTPTVTFTSVNGNGSGAQGVAQLNALGQLIGVTVTNPGSGYDLPPTVSFSPISPTFGDNPGVAAVATIAMNQSATLTVNGATISNNHALTGPGGGIGNAGSSTVTITRSTLANNSAGLTGGGFADENNFGTLVLANSVVANNVATGDGGGIQEGGPLTSISNSQITGNASGARGGGVFADGTTLFVQNSTIANNTAAGDMGTGQGGGGIELETTGTGLTASTITNTTIAGNRALNSTAEGAFGGGIDALTFSGDLVLQNDTINVNYAGVGGGIVWEGTSAGSIALQNTILAGNVSPLGVDALNAIRPYTDLGGNVIGVAGDFNKGFTADTTQTGTLASPLNPLLAPLANNNGPVIGAPGATQILQTEALLTGSPAIGQGTLARAPVFDERGVATLMMDGTIDVGAVSAVVTPTSTPTQVKTSMPLVVQKTINGIPTTYYNVNSTADTHSPSPGTLTLRAALDMANGAMGNKVIQLLVPGIYRITLAGANTGTNTSGAFAILPSGGNVAILNASGGTITVDGNHLDRVFDINPGNDTNFNDEFTVTLQGITITNGLAQLGDGADGSGGGIRDQGIASLTLNNDIVTNNMATADGGGIAMENSISTHWILTTNNTTISGNHAGDAGGGIETDGSSKVYLNAGTVITGNTCVNQGAGVWLDAVPDPNSADVLQSAALMVTGAIISNNEALDMLGGGIGNAGNGAVTINKSTISNNFSGGTGGGFADANNQGNLTVTDSLFLNNVAVDGGGGIQEGGPSTTITCTELAGNVSGNAGGGLLATGTNLSVLNSTFANNLAAGDGNGLGGGGIELQTTGTANLTNTTITGNRALNSAGANGGGIDATALAGTVLLLNDSINANFATNGGGVFWGGMTGSSFSLENTILAQNFIENGGAGVDANNTAGAFTDLGGNLIGVAGDANTGFTASSTQTGSIDHPLNALFAALGNYGGPTLGAPGAQLVLQTEALLTGSPALGKGIKTGAPLTDARGISNGNRISAGAVNV